MIIREMIENGFNNGLMSLELLHQKRATQVIERRDLKRKRRNI